MQLEPHVESLREQLAVAAAPGGDEAQELTHRLTAALASAVRLTLLEALSAAAAEITSELAPGSVELRLRGSEPEFVVTPPPAEPVVRTEEDAQSGARWAAGPGAAGESMTARINLRLPDQLKSQVESSAERDGLSINAWLVRAVGAAVYRAQAGPRGEPGTARSGQRYTGWAR